ncbi:hypothetical protein PHYSODRAFT_257183 [Phytophthora sojae]|uniref:Uncharacterized protein n=1 Tax=Phytophthora sojae (strain P6497) TaxID=1094619 RepID=G4YLU4_PHYSP|nr:hypothetical protein PHYSODRAFT_257183 [Phytophthora sojae]EGZ26714.1 hypothetical protein PHYSODRAFT_257183 [Phytophthora sojae]|eukprot:XP_009513989.1 hypothetical protein PHYSODRAFT_257183 [Phytophthora sojae]
MPEETPPITSNTATVAAEASETMLLTAHTAALRPPLCLLPESPATIASASVSMSAETPLTTSTKATVTSIVSETLLSMSLATPLTLLPAATCVRTAAVVALAARAECHRRVRDHATVAFVTMPEETPPITSNTATVAAEASETMLLTAHTAALRPPLCLLPESPATCRRRRRRFRPGPSRP